MSPLFSQMVFCSLIIMIHNSIMKSKWTSVIPDFRSVHLTVTKQEMMWWQLIV